MFTVDMLIEKKACASQVQLFRDTFPNGAPLTVETAISVSHLFDWEFAARRFLSKEGYKSYQDATVPLLKAYQGARAPLWKVYQDATASHLKVYQDAKAPHLKVYQGAKAQVFAELYIKEAYK